MCDINELGKRAEETGVWWIQTEPATDLFWYKNILCVKVNRQLDNRELINKGEEEESIDYNYTKYVLKECIDILNDSLERLIEEVPNQKDVLQPILARLNKMSKKIIEI